MRVGGAGGRCEQGKKRGKFQENKEEISEKNDEKIAGKIKEEEEQQRWARTGDCCWRFVYVFPSSRHMSPFFVSLACILAV